MVAARRVRVLLALVYKQAKSGRLGTEHWTGSILLGHHADQVLDNSTYSTTVTTPPASLYKHALALQINTHIGFAFEPHQDTAFPKSKRSTSSFLYTQVIILKKVRCYVQAIQRRNSLVGLSVSRSDRSLWTNSFFPL